MKARVQLSLFVPPLIADRLEQVRELLDPVQAQLIPAHVTLCREDELQDIDFADLGAIVASSGAGAIRLKFGGPEVFQGHGVLLPCIEGEEEFHEVRCRLLGYRSVRRHAPHITLAHPRNPRSPQNSVANHLAVQAGLVITFAEVQHIRQEASMPWRVLARHALAGAAYGGA